MALYDIATFNISFSVTPIGNIHLIINAFNLMKV